MLPSQIGEVYVNENPIFRNTLNCLIKLHAKALPIKFRT